VRGGDDEVVVVEPKPPEEVRHVGEQVSPAPRIVAALANTGEAGQPELLDDGSDESRR